MDSFKHNFDSKLDQLCTELQALEQEVRGVREDIHGIRSVLERQDRVKMIDQMVNRVAWAVGIAGLCLVFFLVVFPKL